MNWRNTWLCGPGSAQRVLDDLELGPRVAMRWASGRYGCVGGLQTPASLARLDPPPNHTQRGQLRLEGT